MAIFERFRQIVASGRRQTVEEGLSDPVYTDTKRESLSPEEMARLSDRRERIATLTPREYELFLLLLEGFTLKESAGRLTIKYSTANTHMTGLYKKLGVNSRAGLIINYRNMAAPQP